MVAIRKLASGAWSAYTLCRSGPPPIARSSRRQPEPHGWLVQCRKHLIQSGLPLREEYQRFGAESSVCAGALVGLANDHEALDPSSFSLI